MYIQYYVSFSTRLLTCRMCLVCWEGVKVLAVGVDQADTEELRRVVTDGSARNLLYARDATQLGSLHTDLADLLCGIARTREVRK